MLRALVNLVTPTSRADHAAPHSPGNRPTSDPAEKEEPSGIVDLDSFVDPPGQEEAGIGQAPAQPGAGPNTHQQVMGPDLRHSGEEQSLQPESERSEDLQQHHGEAEEKTSSSTHRSSRMNEDTVGRSTTK